MPKDASETAVFESDHAWGCVVLPRSSVVGEIGKEPKKGTAERTVPFQNWEVA